LIAKGGDMPKEVRSFIETHSVETIADITRENLAENVLPAVTKLTGEPAGALHDAVESVFTSVVTRLVVE
jgi:hypothetical protein